jgi:hypothetical protein
MGASWDGTHVATVAGIAGNLSVGAWSIALSGGYEDDLDEGYRFVYTGSGGRDCVVRLSICAILMCRGPGRKRKFIERARN